MTTWTPRINRRREQYGRLYVTMPGERPYHWICLCDCGNVTEVNSSHLTSRDTRHQARSCGCFHRERTAAMGRNTRTHGHTRAPEGRKAPSRTMNSYTSMKQRVTNPNDPDYHRYGGRGIRICTRWANSFENFLNDMGERPPETSLDRIDNDGHYEPGNCRWATRSQQVLNRPPRKLKTYCKRGHELAPENIYIKPDGYRECRQCRGHRRKARKQ